jgi:hypothetical protein
VVPSKSLRLHLASRLVAELGSIAGITIQTAFGLAREIITKSGLEISTGAALAELLVRRLAPQENELKSALEEFESGYDVVQGVVRDLLDAGFTAEHYEGVSERLAELKDRVGEARLRRALAIVRLATRVSGGLNALGGSRTADAPALASEILRQVGPSGLPCRRVLVHGYADATGVTADFLESLKTILDAVFVIDRPNDPADYDEDVGCRFLERLEVRLGGVPRETDTKELDLPSLSMVEAANPEEEARWLATELRQVLDDGITPESILLVTQNLETWAPRLRRHLGRLGIPFSGIGTSVPAGALRVRVEGLVELLKAGGDFEVERWEELRGPGLPSTDLLLGLRVLGVIRLTDLIHPETLKASIHGVKLPFVVLDESGDCRERPRLPRASVESAIADAKATVEILDSWPVEATAQEHWQWLRRLMISLEWSKESHEVGVFYEVIATLETELPSEVELLRDEWIQLLAGKARASTGASIGGKGGGVQLLTVTEARARTAERVFFFGAVRGVLPRVISDDPLLPDVVRGHLAADVLPEMPVKARSVDEERYLFAQLLSAAPRVTLSWSRLIDSKLQAPSPFVDRLRLAHDIEPVVAAQYLQEELAEVPRSALEHAIADGQNRTGSPNAIIVEGAVAEGRAQSETSWSVAADSVAAARLGVAAELEPGSKARGPGPWSGLIGSSCWELPDSIAVTKLEAIARCPWQAFVTRRLNVAPMQDPLQSLPELSQLLVGNLVHEVLERVVNEALGEPVDSLEDARYRQPVKVTWPSQHRVDELIDRVAEQLARDAGLAVYGVAPLLAARARPYLDVARDVVAPDLDAVLGPEVNGSITLENGARTLTFRTDRVDQGEDGLVLWDYKTGKPVIGDATKKSTRDDRLSTGVSRGHLLQGVAYARAARGIGCYVSLKPDLEEQADKQRKTPIDGSNAELILSFDRAVAAVISGWRAGSMFPRVEDRTRPYWMSDPCTWCVVREACIIEDSGRRRRLVDWLNADCESARTDGEREARALWSLGKTTQGESA